MVTKINLKIEIIVHATEDYQKISDSLYDIFEIESELCMTKAGEMASVNESPMV